MYLSLENPQAELAPEQRLLNQVPTAERENNQRDQYPDVGPSSFTLNSYFS